MVFDGEEYVEETKSTSITESNDVSSGTKIGDPQ